MQAHITGFNNELRHLSLKTYLKNFFFLFSRTNSLERAFLPSSTIQVFSVVEASSLLAVLVAISYTVTRRRDRD